MGAMVADNQGQGYVLPVTQWFAPSLTRTQRSPLDDQGLLQTGRSAKGFASGPMAEVVLHGTQFLTDADASAMALYLQSRATVAPPAAPIGSVEPGASVANRKGAQIYEKHCADCHGKEGQGRNGAYPALAGNPAVLRENSNNLVLMVLQGGYPAATLANPRPHGMPPFVLQLNNAEIAAVLTTVRSSWGNRAGPVSEFDINKLRLAQSR
jgi:mono/diheme cytochrome c family protein